MTSQSIAIQVKAIEQYYPVVLFVVLYRVVLTFQSVNENPVCANSNKKPNDILTSASEQRFPAILFILLYNCFAVDKIPKCAFK